MLNIYIILWKIEYSIKDAKLEFQWKNINWLWRLYLEKNGIKCFIITIYNLLPIPKMDNFLTNARKVMKD